MPDTPLAARPTLTIPDASFRALLGASSGDGDHVETIRQVAVPVVVARLREIADRIGGTDYGRVAAQVLHQDADELAAGEARAARAIDSTR